MKSSSQHSTTHFIITGLLFSMLWASASVAGKIGMQSVEPLLLFDVRFMFAGVLMLLYAHLFTRNKLPKSSDWKQLTLFGLLNTTLYLGLYIIALKQVSAGIGSLALATNPLMISVLTAVWTGRKVKRIQWLSIALGMIGVIIATYPLLENSTATVQGLGLMLLSMLCYSAGVIYFAETKWQLPSIVINGWQVFIGGILLLPFSYLMHHPNTINHFDARFWASEGWLIIPVSIISVQLWLYLLKVDAVRASLWLFLCPVFGFIYAAILLNEPITLYTVIGTVLVIIGLYLGQKKKQVKE
jgi:probable blue pigment (indigoidine) exporter